MKKAVIVISIIIVALIIVVLFYKKSDYRVKSEQSSAIILQNTPEPDYAEYRKVWKRTNSNPTDGYKLVAGKIEKDTVEIDLDDLSFGEAFSIEHRAKGEGCTFWWRGTEYTTNLLESEE
jgi:predicted GTPase